MDHANQSLSMDEVQKFLDADKGGDASTRAVLLFLYKEILVNRMLILEMKPHDNTPNISHYEKMINEINEKLMVQMKK